MDRDHFLRKARIHRYIPEKSVQWCDVVRYYVIPRSEGIWWTKDEIIKLKHFLKQRKSNNTKNINTMFGFWTNESSFELELRVEEFRRRNEPLTEPITPPSTPETMSPLSTPPRLVRKISNYYTPCEPTQLEFESDDE